MMQEVYDWSMALVVCASTYSAFFYYLSWKKGILSSFGRRAQSWDTLAKLTCLALCPGVFTLSFSLVTMEHPIATWFPAVMVFGWILLGLSGMYQIGERMRVDLEGL